MQEVRRRMQIFLVLFLLVTAFGTAGFMALENLSFTDALYYNIVTISTVGYGDIHPTRQASRMFSVLLIVMGGATFLGAVANATEMLILKRETQSRRRKVNMVLGVFFSEVGYNLLVLFSNHNQTVDEVRQDLLVDSNWTMERFTAAQKIIKTHHLAVDIGGIALEPLRKLLNSKRDFIVNLLENPVLIEHENFSEALLVVFHLLDELSSRDQLSTLPESDIKHLAGDMNRAYKKLVEQWLTYLRHLKGQYPYIFSLSVRKNPFNPDADPIVAD